MRQTIERERDGIDREIGWEMEWVERWIGWWLMRCRVRLGRQWIRWGG